VQQVRHPSFKYSSGILISLSDSCDTGRLHRARDCCHCRISRVKCFWSYVEFRSCAETRVLTIHFQVVVNGERNSLTVTIENKSERDVTLINIAGSLHLPDKDVLVKNVCQNTSILVPGLDALSLAHGSENWTAIDSKCTHPCPICVPQRVSSFQSCKSNSDQILLGSRYY
jgi:hypothetical protein